MKSIKKQSYIKLSVLLLAGICLNLLLPLFANAAVMKDYCIIPPYVKTDVKPNIMIIVEFVI